jgi:hypothetical protein
MRILGIIILGLLSCLSYGQVSFRLDSSFVNSDIEISISTKKMANNQVLLSSEINGDIKILDTIFVNGLSNIEFIDFDTDSNKDILISYIGNNPIYSLHLYDLKSQRFVKIDNFEKFPDSKPLSRTELYYSYNRAGCADANWESDLYGIENFKIKHLANIYGQGCACDTISEPQKIEIFKIVTLDKIFLFETLDYKAVMTKNRGDKWKFLNEYWNKNYEQFK